MCTSPHHACTSINSNTQCKWDGTRKGEGKSLPSQESDRCGMMEAAIDAGRRSTTAPNNRQQEKYHQELIDEYALFVRVSYHFIPIYMKILHVRRGMFVLEKNGEFGGLY